MLKMTFALTLAVLPALSVAQPAASGNPKMHFSLYDQATGRHDMFENETGVYELSGGKGGLELTVNDQWSNWWRLSMRPEPSRQMAHGFFPEAGCHYGRIAVLELTNNNPFCMYNRPLYFASFTIRQIEFNAQGRITSLETVFKIGHGSHEAPGTIGTVRYNAYPLFFSQKADRTSRWGALDTTFHGDSTIFKLEGDRRSIRFDAAVPRDIWAFRLQAPTGRKFKVGRYRTAATASRSKAGMDVFFFEDAHYDQPVSRCNPTQSSEGDRAGTGELDIKAIRYDSAGRVSGLHAAYEFRCTSGSRRPEAPVTGEFRINI